MGILHTPDIFQDYTYGLIEEIEFIQCYLDNLLILANDSHKDNLEKVNLTLKYLYNIGLKVNAKKWKFAI